MLDETGEQAAAVGDVPSRKVPGWRSPTLYGDYYFSTNDTAGLAITTVPLLQGFGVRATGGIAATFAGGAQLSAGGEFEEVGGATQI
jgi:hypothetical protein